MTSSVYCTNPVLDPSGKLHCDCDVRPNGVKVAPFDWNKKVVIKRFGKKGEKVEAFRYAPSFNWRSQPRVHVFDTTGCFDFNFFVHNHHVFGFVSKTGIRLGDLSNYDFYFINSGVHFFGYDIDNCEGDKISQVNALDALADQIKPDIPKILAEKFNAAYLRDFNSGECFDYNFIQGGVNCFGFYESGGFKFIYIAFYTRLRRV